MSLKRFSIIPHCGIKDRMFTLVLYVCTICTYKCPFFSHGMYCAYVCTVECTWYCKYLKGTLNEHKCILDIMYAEVQTSRDG